jgi:hypothetical protein
VRRFIGDVGASLANDNKGYIFNPKVFYYSQNQYQLNAT